MRIVRTGAGGDGGGEDLERKGEEAHSSQPCGGVDGVISFS